MIGILSGVKKMDSIKSIKKDYNTHKKSIILELIINYAKKITLSKISKNIKNYQKNKEKLIKSNSKYSY